MPLAKMRPTFEFPSKLTQDQTVEQLRTLIDKDHHPDDGRIAGTHLMLVIPPTARHFWSPWLHIEVHEEDQHASVHGRFSPNPSIWTGYMLAYSAILVLLFFAGIFGVAQLMMNNTPWAFAIIPIFLIIAAAMYWSSLVGQRLANDQMHELHDAVQAKLKETSPSD
ncbi:MAG: hypothetical protein JKY96_04720 [Phycisphaerales bacterium]|nr:hypothetical protein [Phycisphaerales bacterium]